MDKVTPSKSILTFAQWLASLNGTNRTLKLSCILTLQLMSQNNILQLSKCLMKKMQLHTFSLSRYCQIKLLLFKIGTNSSFLQSKRNKVNTNSTILHFQIQKMTQLVWKLIWNLWQNFLLIKTMYSLRLFSIPIFKTLSGYTKSQFPWRMNMEIKANISSCLKF